MLILTDTYAGRALAGGVDYPGGKFKNEVTPGVSDDGTPLEAAWQNDHRGALLAVMDAAGLSPDGEIEKAGDSQFLAAIQSLINSAVEAATGSFTGMVQTFMRTTAPTGFLALNGESIGNASSNATGLAGATAWPLFEILWDHTSNTVLPVETSAGSPIARGISAQADFNANRRIPLPDMRGEFIRCLDDGRGIDIGRLLASWQDEMVGAHTHPYINPRLNGGSADYDFDNARTGEDDTGQNTGTENRPRNIALLACIKL